jgi:NCS1 family nucleobase:cation symporter-1
LNYRGIAALVLGIAVALVGLVVPSLRWLYDYAWFVGFFVSGLAYLALMPRSGAPAAALESEAN